MPFAVTYVQTSTGDPENPKIDIFKVDIKRIGFSKNSYVSHLIDLDPEKEYMVAIDQSTSSTGIAIAEKDFSAVVVFTLVSESKSPYEKTMYIDILLEFIEQLLIGRKLLFLALEEVPPPNNGNLHTYKVLKELKDTIESKLKACPSYQALDADRKFSPYPQQWKSTIFDKKIKGMKGRFNIKSEIAKDIVKIYPFLGEYYTELTKTFGHDYDGFDAFGILTHIRVKHFNPDWGLMNRRSQTQRGTFFVLLKYLDTAEDPEEDTAIFTEQFLSHFRSWSAGLNAEGQPKDLVDVYDWSRDLPIYTNYTMAANSNKIVLMKVENPKLILAYIIMTGQKYDTNKCLWVAVSKEHKDLIRASHLPLFEEAGFFTRIYHKTKFKEGGS